MKRRCLNRRSQVTIFVIIAIVIVGLIGGYFLINKYYTPTIPENIVPVYDNYISCLKNVAKDGASIMASQGGYIQPPEFSPGSEYAPFSNQFDFLGMPVAYWYYISGNGVAKEQIPTQKLMEKQLSDYVKSGAIECDFNLFRNQGYLISQSEPQSSSVSILDNKIKISLNQKISIDYGESNFVINNHKIEINSNLGNFYNLAKKIYGYEKSASFLENYSLDVLYNYAPVSGINFDCAPSIWNPYSVVEDLKKALEANIGTIKLSGNYYTLNDSIRNYFVTGKSENINLGNSQVSFLYSGNWPSRFEVWPTKNNLMIANPVGNQQGLGIMGFCYAPYQFVYDMSLPILIQIYNPNDPGEIFQFPVAVVISKNVPRQSLPADSYESADSLCDDNKMNSELRVNTYNINLEPVEADLEFKCLNDACNLGKTKLDNSSGIATINTKVPQCFNGILVAKSEGYGEKKIFISTNEENSAEVVLDKQYSPVLEIYVDGILTDNMGVLTIGEKANEELGISGSFDNVIYPFSKSINLAEGDFDFDLKIYKSNSNINIPATKTKQCIDIPQQGILGLFGAKEEKCSEITIPAQKLTNALYAGGKINKYITLSELENGKVFRIYAKSVAPPTSIEDIQNSYDLIEGKSLKIEII